MIPFADTKYHWKVSNWKIRTLKGLKEHIQSGASKDTVLLMEPTDLVYSKGQQETFTSPELLNYISKQTSRGSGNVVQYEVEFHKRIAMSFSSFILTIIGLSLSHVRGKVEWDSILESVWHWVSAISCSRPFQQPLLLRITHRQYWQRGYQTLSLLSSPTSAIDMHQVNKANKTKVKTTLIEEGQNSKICILKI